MEIPLWIKIYTNENKPVSPDKCEPTAAFECIDTEMGGMIAGSAGKLS